MDGDMARPLGGYGLFHSTDVDEVRDNVARVYCDHRLVPTGPASKLDAWQNAFKLKRSTLSAMGYGADVKVDPGKLDRFYLLMLPYSGCAEVEAGGRIVVANNQVGTILNPTELIHMRWSEDCAKLMVRIEREAVEQQLSMMLGRTLRSPLNFQLAMPREGNGETWWHLVHLMTELVECQAGRGTTTMTLECLETALISALLESQPHNYSEGLNGRGCMVAPRHVRIVEQYIEEHADKPIGVEDLVQVSGVSGRALYDGFRRFRETSPMAHLRQVRLRRVRDDLLEAPEGATVSNIASRWGFCEFGRFAGQYRQMFGETPSHTLRRR